MNFTEVTNNKGRKRILGSMLPQHVGESVCLIGTLVQLDPSGRMLKMKSSDDQLITVQLQDPLNGLIEKVLEVQGTVSPNSTIQCTKCIPLDDAMTEKFDSALYTAAIQEWISEQGRFTMM